MNDYEVNILFNYMYLFFLFIDNDNVRFIFETNVIEGDNESLNTNTSIF